MSDAVFPSKSLLGLFIAVAVVAVTIASFFWMRVEPARISQDVPDDQSDDVLFMPLPMTLAPGIYMLGRLAPSVAYVVETSDGLVLVDAGVQPDAAALTEQLEGLSLKPSALKSILLTHVHGDHTLGARYLRDITGARIYAGKGDADVLRAGTPREAFFSTFAMEGHQIHSTSVDVELEGGEVLQFGDTKISVIATPGHTPGSVCYLLERGNLSVLFAGDTISSLVGDIGTYSAYLAPRYRGDAETYLDSLRTLRALPVPDFVLPGHPTSTQIPHSPKLTESEWHQLLDRGIRDMEQLVARFEADGRDFLDGNPKQLLPGLLYLGDHGQRPVYALITESQQFLFDAPGASGLVDFVEERLRSAGSKNPDITAVFLTSCDTDMTAGLAELVSRYKCSVVAAATEHEFVRALCPPDTTVIDPAGLDSQNWFSVKARALGGRGRGSTAYSLSVESKTVLISGKYPISLNDASVLQLANELRSSTGDPTAYIESLRALRNESPELWLPALVAYGQNANVYGNQWASVIDSNFQLLGNPRSRP